MIVSLSSRAKSSALILVGVMIALILLAMLLPGMVTSGQAPRIAYIFWQDKETAANFASLLESENYQVEIFTLSQASESNFKEFDLLIIADDTGSQGEWGQGFSGLAKYLDSFSKPVIGLGEGGYAYLGQLGREIGWPNGAHGQGRAVIGDPSLVYYQTPYDLTSLLKEELLLFEEDNGEVAIYQPKANPGVIPLGRDVNSREHYPLIAQQGRARCDQLWGFRRGPKWMTGEGRRLFANAVYFGLRNCPEQTTPTPTRTPTPTTTPTPTPSFPIIYPIPVLPPIIVNPQPFPADLSIDNIELTQAIQCLDTSQGLATCADNSLRLAIKKGSTARIYLRYDGPLARMNGVPVRIYFRANGVWYQADATGNAVKTLDRGADDSADVWFKVDFSKDITVDVYAVVDPNNIIAETNENNNRFPASGYITKTFRKRDTMKIVGQRLRYHPSGYSGGQYAGGWAVNGGAADYFERILPIQDGGIDYSIKSGYLDWTTSLGSGSGQHSLIQTLNAMWILDQAFGWIFGGAFLGADHVYGWVDNDGYSGGHADMPVYPHAGGLGVVGIGTDRPGTSTDNPGGGALIFAHELLHDYDIKHTDTPDACGSTDGSSNFPYSSSSIQEFGYNPNTNEIYDPSDTHDVMSYCPAGGSKRGWMSPYTWEYMSNKIDAAQVQALADRGEPVRLGPENFRPAQSERTLVVFAAIANPDHPDYNPRQPGRLYNMHLIDGRVTYPLPGDGYAIQLRRGDRVLYQEDFGVSFESEYHSEAHRGQADPHPEDDPPFPPEPTAQADVQLIIPWVEETDNIVLVQGDKVLARQVVSAHPPKVEITNPTSPQTWPAGSTQKVTWQASDSDGDALTYSIFYSHEDDNWTLLATGLTATEYMVDVDAFAGGDKARFRVVATDGVLTGMDVSAPVSIPNKAPFVTISEPVNGRSFAPGALVVMQGNVVDMEEGTLDASRLQWRSNRDGVLGSGPSLALNTLSPGYHTLTLTAKDASNQTSQASVEIFIGYRDYLPMQVK